MSERPSADDPGRLTRVVATLVLVPTVPMLLAAVAALALFYVAPGRFGAILARLPGDEFVRTILIFAPATLFAVVVLAVLYALDRPPAQVETAAARAEPYATAQRLDSVRIATWGLLAPGLPLLVLSVGLWLFSFVAPDRFAALLEPLPGDRYLQLALRGAPVALLAVVVPAAFFLLFGARRPSAPQSAELSPSRPVRWGVGLTLVATLPLLGLSLAALGFFLFTPERFDRVISILTQETFLRLALIVTPAVLMSVVLLSVLFLYFSNRPSPPSPSGEEFGEVEAAAARLQEARQGAALWVLTGGLAGSAVVALGLVGVALYLVLR